MQQTFYCPTCRAPVFYDAPVCQYCGNQLNWQQQAPPTGNHQQLFNSQQQNNSVQDSNYHTAKVFVPSGKPEQKSGSRKFNFDKFIILVIVVILVYAILQPLLKPYTFWITGGFLLLMAALIFVLIKYPSFRYGLFSAFKSIFNKIWLWISTPHEKHQESQETNIVIKRTRIPRDVERQVIGRAQNRCQWVSCRITGNLDIHHIDGNPSHHRLNNLIYLCPNHHRAAHSLGARKFQLQDWARGKYSA